MMVNESPEYPKFPRLAKFSLEHFIRISNSQSSIDPELEGMCEHYKIEGPITFFPEKIIDGMIYGYFDDTFPPKDQLCLVTNVDEGIFLIPSSFIAIDILIEKRIESVREKMRTLSRLY